MCLNHTKQTNKEERQEIEKTHTRTVNAGCTRVMRRRRLSNFVSASTALARQYLKQNQMIHKGSSETLAGEYTDSSVRRLGSSTRRPNPGEAGVSGSERQQQKKQH